MENVAIVSWWPSLAVSADLQGIAGRAACTDSTSDETLMHRYRDGDDAAFRSLYSRHRASLLRFAQHLTGRASEADEVFQETWLAVIRSRSRYTARAHFVTWLFSIAHRRAADGYRRRARRPTSSGPDATRIIESVAALATDEPSEIAFENARQRALEAAIAALPFEQREVFLLRAETGLGVREIASVTQTNAETTKSRLRYALRTLRKVMVSWS